MVDEPAEKRRFPALRWFGGRKPPPIPKTRLPSPEANAGFFSLLLFSWLSPIMAVGYRRPLELNDIWLLNHKRSTGASATTLKANLASNRARGVSKPLTRAILQTFRTDLAVGALAALTSTLAQGLIPFVLKYIIAFAGEVYQARVAGLPGPSVGRGVGLVIGIVVMQILGSIGYNHFFYRGMLVGGQSRSVLMSVIFDKAMTISGRAKAGGRLDTLPRGLQAASDDEKKFIQQQLDKEKDAKDPVPAPEAWSNGRIVNLMSVDTSRIDTAFGWLHMAWTAPLSLVITVILLLVNLTYSALVGLALFFTATPLIAYIVRIMLRNRKKINKITDERTSMTQEVLQAIRFVKYYAWEADFLARLRGVRRREIHAVRFLLAHRNVGIAIGMAVPVFSSMLTFITFSLTNHDLNPAAVFSSLALFNQLRLPLIMLPMAIGQLTDAIQSLSRIEQFLLAEDAVDTAAGNEELPDGLAIDMQQASFTWEQNTPPTSSERKDKPKTKTKTTPATSTPKPEAPPFTLDNITLQARPGELIAVIGHVGSGKTSLLSAIAGDMRQTSGLFHLHGKRGFCAQVPWIQNATVRDNITFGQAFDQARYDAIVDACALAHDLAILPHGSDTEIGERGITLSGGQKHRVSLARAIYFDADVVLLDDPLSAVDPHVGAHIFERALCGLLRAKCRVLATHQLHVLPRCDRVVMVEKGRIVACDTFEGLLEGNAVFRGMMEQVNFEERSGDVDVAKAEDASPKVAAAAGSNTQEALMKEEDRQVKGISTAVYLDYWRSTGSLLVPLLVVLLLAVAQGANIVTSLWLAWWSNDHFGYSTGTYIGIYAALGAAQALLLFVATLGFTFFGTRASKTMLYRAVSRILHAPLFFFDTTPLGRIMNRFSKDIDTMDNLLTESLRSAGTTVFTLLSIVILVVVYYYWFAIALAPLLLMYLLWAIYYHASAVEIKRHEATLRSTVFAQFNEAVVGTPTIRAYGMQRAFAARLLGAIDDMAAAYYLTFANQRWLGVRLDAIGAIFLLVTGMLVVTDTFASSIPPSIAGLVLSYVVSITQTLLLAVRQVADAQNNMNAVERVHYYAHSIPQEGNGDDTGKGEKAQRVKVPESWPQQGQISFRDVRMRYREGLPLVLDGFSLDVGAGERLGIVGRTGAGKSSLMAALFRMVELADGQIVVDGVDVAAIALPDLRSRLAIIPQDVTLFRGTVRSNLDPFGKHTDLELWSALRQAHLLDDGERGVEGSEEEEKEKEPEQGGRRKITLETTVEADGANFSLGQRQLMGLARALVRDSRIIVCDEATSSIDLESDAKVQRAMAEGFRGKTVLCIAHRLKTIVGYDRVCVIESGGVAELGTPLELYDQGGRFRAMCDQSQISRDDIELAGRQGLLEA